MTDAARSGAVRPAVKSGSVGARLLAALLGLVGFVLTGGGLWLIALGGSPWYLAAGLVSLTSATGLFRARGFAGLLYGVFLVATLVWAMAEAGLAPWPLVARLAGPAVIGLLVSALATGARSRLASLVASLTIGFVIALAFMLPHPESFLGQASVDQGVNQVAAADWLHYGNEQGGSRFSPAVDITPANVAGLKVAWTYHTGSGPQARYNNFEAVPIEANGIVTFCTGYNDVIALDAATGKQRWRWRAHDDMTNVVAATCRGVARFVVPGASGLCSSRIITATLDSRMVALDALSGVPCPDFGHNGTVDLREGMGPVVKGYSFVTSAPAIVRGKAVIGGWILDGQYVGEPSGVIRAFDAVTGRLAWAWDMGRPDRTGAPGPGERYTPGTPNSWAPISADETLGMVYLPMGNSTPDYFGAYRNPVSEHYSSGVVALDAETGRERWMFQTTHHDIWDYDGASQPVLFDLPSPGGTIPALAQATKRAQLFLLDRRTGKPLTQVVENAVSQQAAPGERPAPTQPFSMGMPDLSGPNLTESMMWGMTPIDQMICRIMFRQAEYKGPLTPIQLNRRTIEYPGYVGGMDWGSVTIDPVRQLLLVNTNRFANYNMLITRAEARKRGIRVIDGKAAADSAGAQPMEGTPYAVDVRPFVSPLFMPCQQPPYGFMSAVDLKTRKLVWNQPFGTTRNAGPLGKPLGLALPMGVPSSGGAISTASGLTFIGASQDGMIRAYDSRTGRVLWEEVLPYGGQATPMTYKLRGGRQFVVIAAGGSAGMLVPTGDMVVAYALP
jgi:quinoprotein glucose dehydrogenase